MEFPINSFLRADSTQMGTNFQTTTPRGPVAAMFPSPGPKYQLPSLIGSNLHDIRSIHTKGPSYSFGAKINHKSFIYSPGPCYYPSPEVTKTGKESSPKFSLYSRVRDISLYATPAPNIYSPEINSILYHSSPSYSFGLRQHNRTTNNNPAANSYKLAPVMGRCVESKYRQAPTFSFASKTTFGGFDYDLKKTPGPGTYNVTDSNFYKPKAPTYSLTSRNLPPLDCTQKPSPSTYYPNKLNATKKAAPGFSFGIRHSPYIAPLIVETKD